MRRFFLEVGSRESTACCSVESAVGALQRNGDGTIEQNSWSVQETRPESEVVMLAFEIIAAAANKYTTMCPIRDAF